MWFDIHCVLKMKLLITLLLSLFVISQSKKITRLSFPNDFLKKAKDFSATPVAGDCKTITKFENEFNKCESLISGTPAEKNEKLANLIMVSIKTKDVTTFISNMDAFCKGALATTKCIDALDKVCKSDGNYVKVDQYVRFQKLNNPAYGAIAGGMCDKDGVFMKDLKDKVKDKKITDCLKTDKAFDKISDAMDRVITFLRKFKKTLDKRAPGDVEGRTTPAGGIKRPQNSNENKDMNKLKAICNQRNSFMKFLGSYTSECDSDLRKFMMEIGAYLIPTEAGKLCAKPKTDGNMKLDRLDKKRLSMFIFGGMNYFGRGGDETSNSIETCTAEDGDEVVMIDTTKMQLKCTVKKKGDYYAFLNACTLVFEDIDELDLTGTKVPEGFKKSKGKEIKGKGKGKGSGGSPDFDIKIERANDKKIVVTDKNSGIAFGIRIFITRNNDKVLNINMRVPKSLIDIGTGAFAESCSQVVDKSNPSASIDGEIDLSVNNANLRFKRSPNSDEVKKSGEYDAAGLDDPAAASMATNAVSENGELTSLDASIISTSSGISVKMSIVSLLAVFIGTIGKYLF